MPVRTKNPRLSIRTCLIWSSSTCSVGAWPLPLGTGSRSVVGTRIVGPTASALPRIPRLGPSSRLLDASGILRIARCPDDAQETFLGRSQLGTTPVEQLRQALQGSDWTVSEDAQTVRKRWIHGMLSTEAIDGISGKQKSRSRSKAARTVRRPEGAMTVVLQSGVFQAKDRWASPHPDHPVATKSGKLPVHSDLVSTSQATLYTSHRNRSTTASPSAAILFCTVAWSTRRIWTRWVTLGRSIVCEGTHNLVIAPRFRS